MGWPSPLAIAVSMLTLRHSGKRRVSQDQSIFVHSLKSENTMTPTINEHSMMWGEYNLYSIIYKICIVYILGAGVCRRRRLTPPKECVRRFIFCKFVCYGNRTHPAPHTQTHIRTHLILGVDAKQWWHISTMEHDSARALALDKKLASLWVCVVKFKRVTETCVSEAAWMRAREWEPSRR